MSYRATAYEELLRAIVDDIEKLRKRHEMMIEGVDPASPEASLVVATGLMTATKLLVSIRHRAKEVLRRD